MEGRRFFMLTFSVNSQCFYNLQYRPCGFAAVGNRVFLVGGKFRDRLLELGKVDYRVVAKAAGAARVLNAVDYSSFHSFLRDEKAAGID